jgi:hypothetical protein
VLLQLPEHLALLLAIQGGHELALLLIMVLLVVKAAVLGQTQVLQVLQGPLLWFP